LRGLAAKHGFVERSVLSVSVRKEGEMDLPGFIVILEKTPA
jgi:hypothetical protein